MTLRMDGCDGSPDSVDEKEGMMSARQNTRDNPGSESTPIRVFCVDDHPALRKGIATIINSEADMFVIAEASDGPEAIDLFRRHQPDVTLMDLRLPGMGGVDATIAIRAEFPE